MPWTAAAIAPPALAVQSMHAPASAAADAVHVLGLWMYAAAAIVALGVLALALKAILAPGRQTRNELWLVGGGVVLPVVALSVLLVAALLLGNRLHDPAVAPAARIQVIAHQWWWEVRYLPLDQPRSELALLLARLCGAPVAAAGARRTAVVRDDNPGAIVLANELRIPVGHPVELELVTKDVIHSLWVPALGGKVDMIPGRINRLVWRAERSGGFRGQCAEYCGGPHGLMGLWVVAEEPDAYREWLERQARVARRAAGAELARGEKAFLRAGCAECHTIRGTPARGTEGPDLTHVGSRRSLAAATLDNHVGTMAGWIADPQSVKPGNRMPPTATLGGAELRALAAYLASLD